MAPLPALVVGQFDAAFDGMIVGGTLQRTGKDRLGFTYEVWWWLQPPLLGDAG